MLNSNKKPDSKLSNHVMIRTFVRLYYKKNLEYNNNFSL